MDMIIECIDVTRGLPFTESDWDVLTRSQKRALGLAARWAMERAFVAVIMARGKALPPVISLCAFWQASGVSLPDLQAQALRMVEREVSAHEPPESDQQQEAYFSCCQLARGVVQQVSQTMAILNIQRRR